MNAPAAFLLGIEAAIVLVVLALAFRGRREEHPAGRARWRRRRPVRTPLDVLLAHHRECEQCTVTDPCRCCGLRYLVGRGWVLPGGTAR